MTTINPYTASLVSISPVQRSLTVASPAAAFTQQVVEQQAALIFNQPLPSQRLAEFGQLLGRAASLTRLAGSLRNSTGCDDPLASRQVQSGNSEAVTGQARDYAKTRSFGVSVFEVARSQQVRSDTINANNAHSFSGSSASFRLTRGGESFDITVDLEGAETNEDVLHNIAASLRSTAGVSVDALVELDEATGGAFISLTSRETGVDAAFELQDLDGSSLLAELSISTDQGADPAAGQGGVARSARDAQYAVDGGEVQTSGSNCVGLFDGAVTLQLQAVGQDPVTISVGADVEGLATRIESFLDEREQMIGFFAGSQATAATGFAGALQRRERSIAAVLADAGISRDAEGTLAVDGDQLREALASNPQGAYSLISRGLAGGVQQDAKQFVDTYLRETTDPDRPVNGPALQALQQAHNQQQLSLLFDPVVNMGIQATQTPQGRRLLSRLPLAPTGLLVRRVA